MGYVGIDTQGARRAGQALTDAAAQADHARQQVTGALSLADLDSEVPGQLASLSDGLAKLGAEVHDRAEVADRFTVDPAGVAAALGAPVDQLAAALTGLIGFTGPTDLRSVLAGLPPPGADPALDAALARLTPQLLPALRSGQRPALDAGATADLRTLAVALGIDAAGPPGPLARGGSEVFWNDFWSDGRTVADVLADPAKVLDWVAGTFELDRRLALATALPDLVDVLSSVDFATTGDGIDAATAEVAQRFAAIDGWLPAFLAGQDLTAPDATQLDETLAFAARVGWADPGAAAAIAQQRFAAAIAFLRANRALASALLPTGFEGSPQPLAFFDANGVGQLLALGARTGVITNASLAGLGGLTDQLAAAQGIDLAGTAPVAVDPAAVQRLLGALLASQVPPSFLQTPGLGPRFEAAVTFVGAATSGPDLRQRVIAAIAAFRTLAVLGAPALTERQLAAIVGPDVVGTLGRGRLRLRAQAAVQRNPEFLLVAAQWGVPGGHKETIGKYKFTWSFDGSGVLTAIRRKKRSWFARAADTIKAIVHSIGDAFEDNLFTAIVQVGKIALGALALVFPGTQALGLAALALNVGDAVLKAGQGDWLGALSAGLSVFTAGAADVFSLGVPSAVDILQQGVVDELFKGFGDPTVLAFVQQAKRAVDIGTSVVRALDAHGLAAVIGATVGAGAVALGSGGQLLQGAQVIGKDLADGLVRLGHTLGDLNAVVAPGAGLVTALDTGNIGQAFANGLSVIAAGAKALGNDKAAFAPGVGNLFAFDRVTQETLTAIAQGTGATAFVTRAIQAANAGQAAQAASFLAQAVEAVNDPRTTVLGNRAQVTQRIADIGTVIESITDSGANPTRVAPSAAATILARLQLLVDAAGTGPKLAAAARAVPAGAGPTTPAPALVPGLTVFSPTPPPARSTLGADGLDPALLGGGPFIGAGLSTTPGVSPAGFVPGPIESGPGLSLSTPGFSVSTADFSASTAGLAVRGAADATVDPTESIVVGGGTTDSATGVTDLDPPAGGASDNSFAAISKGVTLAFGVPPVGPAPRSPGPPSTVPTVPTVPGTVVSTGPAPEAFASPLPVAGDGFPSPVGQRVIKVAIIGDSYLSGEGADGGHWSGNTYVLNLPDTFHPDGGGNFVPTDRAPLAIHQSTEAGAVQAVRLLQADHPDATIRITYSGDGHTETLEPLTGNGDGPILDVRFVAESGATASSMLGPARNQVDSPTANQIEAARDADIVIVSAGGNDAKVSATLTAALLKFSRNNGAEDIQRSIDDIPANTVQVPELYKQIIATAAPSAQIVVMGYPNILAPLLPDGRPGPLGPSLSFLSANIDPQELDLMTVYGYTLNRQLADYVFDAKPRAEQAISFAPQWGHWTGEDTLGTPDAAVNDFSPFFYYESYHPNERGQQLVAREVLSPLEVALDRTLGPTATSAGEPASHLFALSAGATAVTWDTAPPSEPVAASQRSDLSALGLSVTDVVPPARPSSVDSLLMPPSMMDSATDPWTWSSPSAADPDWNSVTTDPASPPPWSSADWAAYSPSDSYTPSVDAFVADVGWDGGGDPWSDAWGGGMETADYGDAVSVSGDF